MKCDTPHKILLDASFISSVKQIDSSCDLVDYFGPCADDANCFVTQQYTKTPCNGHDPECTRLEAIFSDEQAIKEGQKASATQIDFSKISRDPMDIKIFLWAKATDRSAVYTCDKNLLEICCKYDISRLCFKAAIKGVDDWLKGAILKGDEYNTAVLFHGDNPFMNFNLSNRCRSHCMSDLCTCYPKL